MTVNIEYNGKIIASVELPDYAKTAGDEVVTRLLYEKLFPEEYSCDLENIDWARGIEIIDFRKEIE